MSSEEFVFQELLSKFNLISIGFSASLGYGISHALRFEIIHPSKRFFIEVPRRDLFACKDDTEVITLLSSWINQSLNDIPNS